MKTICAGNYKDPSVFNELIAGLEAGLAGYENRTVVICIGSDLSIPDSLGPLVGTMLQEAGTTLPVYGSLEQPLHARNMVTSMNAIKARHPGFLELVVDAALAQGNDIGLIEIKKGAIRPGRALKKDLPAVGQISILGKVGSFPTNNHENHVRLGMVYQMASVIAYLIRSWEKTWR